MNRCPICNGYQSDGHVCPPVEHDCMGGGHLHDPRRNAPEQFAPCSLCGTTKTAGLPCLHCGDGVLAGGVPLHTAGRVPMRGADALPVIRRRYGGAPPQAGDPVSNTVTGTATVT